MGEFGKNVKQFQWILAVYIVVFTVVAVVEFLYESVWVFLYIILIVFNLNTYFKLERLLKRKDTNEKNF